VGKKKTYDELLTELWKEERKRMKYILPILFPNKRNQSAKISVDKTKSTYYWWNNKPTKPIDEKKALKKLRRLWKQCSNKPKCPIFRG
jgi:hypothetical protein